MEAIERFFFVDGGVNIFQNWISPFGAITIDNSLQTNNRTTTYVYRLNPYIQGNVGSDTTYLLRWNNQWTDYSSSALNSSYVSSVIGRIGRPSGAGRRYGWQADYSGSYVKYNNQDPYTLHLGRGILFYQVMPDLQVSAPSRLREQQLLPQLLLRGDLRRRPGLATHAPDGARWILGAQIFRRFVPGELQSPHPAHRVAAHGIARHHHLGPTAAARHGHCLRCRGCRIHEPDPGLGAAAAGSAAVPPADRPAWDTHSTDQLLQPADPAAGSRRSRILTLRRAQQPRVHRVLERPGTDHRSRDDIAGLLECQSRLS